MSSNTPWRCRALFMIMVLFALELFSFPIWYKLEGVQSVLDFYFCHIRRMIFLARWFYSFLAGCGQRPGVCFSSTCISVQTTSVKLVLKLSIKCCTTYSELLNTTRCDVLWRSLYTRSSLKSHFRTYFRHTTFVLFISLSVWHVSEWVIWASSLCSKYGAGKVSRCVRSAPVCGGSFAFGWVSLGFVPSFWDSTLLKRVHCLFGQLRLVFSLALSTPCRCVSMKHGREFQCL